MKSFLVIISFLAAGLFIISSIYSKKHPSLLSLQNLEPRSTQLSLRTELASPTQQSVAPSAESIQNRSNRNPHENSDGDTSTITINNKKYYIATLDENDIETITKTISSSQLNDIRNTILSPSENNMRRHAYLYFLTQIKSTGARSLFEVVKAEVPEFEFQNNPHSVDSDRKSLEFSLRIAALEALDNLASLDPKVGSYLLQLENSHQPGVAQNNSILSYLTSISNAGLDNNNPGKLHRVLNAIFKENETL